LLSLGVVVLLSRMLTSVTGFCRPDDRRQVKIGQGLISLPQVMRLLFGTGLGRALMGLTCIQALPAYRQETGSLLIIMP